MPFWPWILYGKNSDPGSWINIQDPQHCIFLLFRSGKICKSVYEVCLPFLVLRNAEGIVEEMRILQDSAARPIMILKLSSFISVFFALFQCSSYLRKREQTQSGFFKIYILKCRLCLFFLFFRPGGRLYDGEDIFKFSGTANCATLCHVLPKNTFTKNECSGIFRIFLTHYI